VIRHIRNSNYIRRFECNICKKVLATRSSLNVHKRIHLKSRPFKCPYPGCRYTSITNAALKSHLVIHNKSNSTYKCKVCGKEYARRQGLDKHRRMIHPKKAECYQCDLCPATYKDKSYIRRHINEEHLFKDTYCKICNIKFKLKYHLMSHMVTHNTKSEMQRKNQDGKYKCNECFRTFAYESDLKKHSHRRKFGFNCSKCSKKFPSQTELWLHVDVHKAEYPFKCEVCKERFKQINYLNRHAWKHKKIENPFICDHCGKEFQRKNHLGTHLKFFKEKKLGKKYKTGFSAKKLMKEIFSKT
jgi:KRAB domain-containing zinc finger protein